MITVNTIFSQITDNLPSNDYTVIKKDSASDNVFGDIINEVMNNSTGISDSIDNALKLTAQNLNVSYNSLIKRFSRSGNFEENAKSFLYGVALASSIFNTNDQTNIIFSGTNYPPSVINNYTNIAPTSLAF